GTPGFASPMTTEGDLIYQHSAAASRLPVGVAGPVLASNGTDPGGSSGAVNSQSGTAYTYAAGDAGAIVESTNSSATVFTIPPTNSVVSIAQIVSNSSGGTSVTASIANVAPTNVLIVEVHNGSFTGATSITDTFATGYTWSRIVESSPAWLDLWQGVGGSGGTGTVTANVSGGGVSVYVAEVS